MHTDVRPGRGGDADALRELEAEARAAAADHRGGPQLLADHPALGAGWADVLDAPPGRRRVFVATIDEVVLGYLLLSAVAPGGTAAVEQVWVTPGARELGFGDDLLAAAVASARAAGAAAVEAEALPGDRETKNLYERAGITARKLTVWKSL